MNNTSQPGECNWYHTTGKDLAVLVSYNIISPCHFFVGIFGHILCLLAYYHRNKTQTAYMYQIFVTVSETFEITFFSLSIAIQAWLAGNASLGQPWFRSNYYCMWFAAHATRVLCNTFITLSSLFSLSMAADRLSALAKPTQYKTKNHKFNQKLAVIICVLIGFSTSLFDAFRFNVTFNDDLNSIHLFRYKLISNTAFLGNQWAKILTNIRNIIRAISAICLFACNGVIVYLFHKQVEKIGDITGNTAREIKMKKDERVLTFLAMFESFSNALSLLSLCTNQFFIYVIPDHSFYACVGDVLAPISDSITQICTVIDFYILAAINKAFREVIADGARAFTRAISCKTNGAIGTWMQ